MRSAWRRNGGTAAGAFEKFNAEGAEGAEDAENEGLGMTVNEATGRIIGSAVKVHRALGPGMLESVYELCLEYELAQSGLSVERQRALPLVYEGIRFAHGFRVDLLVDQRIVVELKTVDRIKPLHRAQLLSYLRLSGCPVGLLINFNVERLTDGIARIANTRIH